MVFDFITKRIIKQIFYIIPQYLAVKTEKLKLSFSPPRISNHHLLNATGKRFKTIDKFLDRMEKRVSPIFFIYPSQKEKLVEIANREFPQQINKTIVEADKVCSHIFNLLGSGDVFLGRNINWHTDFKSGHRWEQKYYKEIPQYYNCSYYKDPEKTVDIKVPWELSRCQHFILLGKAYWYTGDEKYVKEFIDQINTWIKANPPQFGINWKCTMDVAIRVVNWIWGYYYFKDSPEITDEFRLDFFKNLLSHGRHIVDNLEKLNPDIYPRNTNHYLSDLVGLVYLGIMLPEFIESKEWFQKGISELFSEMEKQVYPNGVDFEASISYHRLVTELFTSAIILCLLNGIDIPRGVMSRLEKMFEFVMYYTKPDGTSPQIGDADDGRLHKLGVFAYDTDDKNNDNGSREFIDHRYLLAIGAVLFERADFARSSGSYWEEAFWIFGEKAIKVRDCLLKQDDSELYKLQSKAFFDGGIYIMRDKDHYMIIDAGSNGWGGHAHNDTLSFELFAYDKSYIIDPGSYIYTADYRWRNLFRSTAYHNTVVVDGEEMNRFCNSGLFSMKNDDTPKVHHWESNERFDIFHGEHNGFSRLDEPIVHRRKVIFAKKEGLWIIEDILTGEGEHQFDLYFHFGPMKLIEDPDISLGIITEKSSGAYLRIIPIEKEGLCMEIEEGWISYSYGKKISAPIVKYSKTSKVPTKFINVLWPYLTPMELTKSDICEKIKSLTDSLDFSVNFEKKDFIKEK